VLDEGVDNNHEDLSGRVLPGYTIGNSSGQGAPQNYGTNNYNLWGIKQPKNRRTVTRKTSHRPDPHQPAGLEEKA